MAARHVQTTQQTPLTDRQDAASHGNAKQPSGPCNYRNLNVGGNVPKCGCLRFTSMPLERPGSDSATSQSGWCVCEHHSCFHNRDPVDGHSISGVSMVEEAQTPKQSTHQTPAQPRLQYMQNEQEVGWAEDDFLPGIQRSNFNKFGASMESLPAIPSQCLLPSETGSRASSSHAGYSRPFGGRGLDTLSHIPKPNTLSLDPPAIGRAVIGDNGKVMQIYEDSNGQGQLQSLTEIATPSRRSSQDLDAEVTYTRNATAVQKALHTITEGNEVTMTLRPSEDTHAGSNNAISATLHNESNDDNLLPKIRSIMNHVADYPETKRNHEYRLDQLENSSFSHPVIEEMKDQHEMLDTRVHDLEIRMEDVEKHNLYETSSVGSKQIMGASMDSRSSSALISHAINNLDSSRIEALEAQILELQAIATPSHLRPWEVEVVFLPFGPQLMGIWSTKDAMSQRPRMNSASGDEWTQTQQSGAATDQARLTTHHEAIAWDVCAADLDEDTTPWLIPRACNAGSRVDQRLRSRGLVRKILVKGPDARDVQAAMLSAFGDLPGILARDPYSDRHRESTWPDSLAQYFGLRVPWIPLRKDHKISALRFLNVSEMVTPALWTVNFLSSSVVMRSTGLRRLYVTHPDSYIQHLGSTVSWTWQKLRQLDRVYPDLVIRHTPEADAVEPCWEFDARYDTVPSLNSSFSSHHSLSIRQISHEDMEPRSPSDHFSSAPASPTTSTTPTSLPAYPKLPISPLRERNPFRPPVRTTSMPLVPIKTSPSQSSKRPLVSYDAERETQSSPGGQWPIPLHISKRHRTRSPSRPRDTPRWSTGPPSPYAYVDEFNHKRGSTPFAYATPHSNGPYVERHQNGNSSGEDDDYDEEGEEELGSTTDNESEIGGGEKNALSDFDADEWEGVEEHDSRIAGTIESLRQENEDSGSESCPSEYPSTQPEVSGNACTKAGFRIHVDDEIDLPDTY